MLSPGVRVKVAESVNHDLGKVCEWCDLWVMKLNASKTKTTIISRSCTVHPHSLPLTAGGKSDDIDVLGETFDSKMTFKKHLRLVSREDIQRHGEYLMIVCSWRDSLAVLSFPFWSTVLQCGARRPIHT